MTAQELIDAMEAAFDRKDVEGLVALFTEDATIESYLVMRVFDRKEGICRGHDELRMLARTFMARGKPWGGHGPPIVQGDTVVVEYFSPSSAAEKFSVDVIELRDGKIRSMRAYAGWRALTKAP